MRVLKDHAIVRINFGGIAPEASIHGIKIKILMMIQIENSFFVGTVEKLWKLFGQISGGNIIVDAYNRFDLIFEDSAEEIRDQKEKKEKELKELRAAALEERRRIETNGGGCEGCGAKEYNRWVHNGEVYLCRDCFMHDLQFKADMQSPMHSTEDTDGYDEYLNWDNLWENNE